MLNFNPSTVRFVKNALILIFFLVSGVVSAQTAQSVSGEVYDEKTDESLPFTTIVVVGKGRGTVANADGRFVLDLQGLKAIDSVSFSFVGYETKTLAVSDLRETTKVSLRAATVNLNAVAVLSQTLTANEIVGRVLDNYETNHPRADQKQRIFLHKYERTPFPEKNKVVLKESDFEGLDKATFEDLFSKLPNEFVAYQDAIVELYRYGGASKLVPVEAISLEEGSQQELFKEMEDKLSVFFDDIEKAKDSEDVYYKFRSGIFAADVDEGDMQDSLIQQARQDAIHYLYRTEYIKSELLFLLSQYASLGGKNWEFLNKTNKYTYSLGGVTVFNDELVYKVDFAPRKGGMFVGSLFVSTDTYGILQLDFAFADGKTDENIHLLGVGHSMVFKKGQVIFEHRDGGYFVKYINAQQREKASVERNFSFMKKEKRFLWDKTLNEMKLSAELFFDINSSWELLIINHEPLNNGDFQAVKEPETMKFKKEYAYSADAWEHPTVIAPANELKAFKRTER